MSDQLTAQYRRWFEYERDAHAKVLAALGTVPADRRGGPEFLKAVSLLGHIVAARRIWLGRLGGPTPPPGPMFPDHGNPDQVAADWAATADAWADHLAGLTDADLERVFEYQALDGRRFRNRVEDVLAQL